MSMRSCWRTTTAGIRAAISLAGDGGCRKNEIISINQTDIDFKNGRFLVKRNVFWKKGQAIVDAPKGRKAKPVPATARLLQVLKASRHLRGERIRSAKRVRRSRALASPKSITL